MRGSPEIFLMPPTSFGVRTRVMRNDPLWCPTGVKQDPSNTLHHFRRVLMLRFPKTWPALALNQIAFHIQSQVPLEAQDIYLQRQMLFHRPECTGARS